MSISDSALTGLRCGGKTGLAMAQAQREFMDNWEKLSLDFAGGIKQGELVFIGGGRSQGKSYFEDIFLHREDIPDSSRTFEILKERKAGKIGSFIIDDWENVDV